MVSSSTYPWVIELYFGFEKDYKKLLDSFTQMNAPRMVYQSPYSIRGTFNSHREWEVDDKIFQFRSNYSCVFPKRVVFLTAPFIRFEAGFFGDVTELAIPLDFFSQLFSLKPALINELTVLLPRWVISRDEDGTISRHCGVYNIEESKGTFSITSGGYGYSQLIETQSELKISLDNKQLLKTPWLVGGNLQQFVDLVSEHSDEFFLYTSAISKFFDSEDVTEKKLLEWLQNLAIATKELDVAFKRKRQELAWKGVDVGIGVVCTIASLFIPNSYVAAQIAIPTLFGSKTVYDVLTWLRDYKTAKDALGTAQQWLLWRSL